MLARIADRSCSCRQAALGDASRFQTVRIVPRPPSGSREPRYRRGITGHLLLRQRRYGFHVLDRLDRELDSVAETNGVKYQTILHLEVLCSLPCCPRRKADADVILSFVDARDDVGLIGRVDTSVGTSVSMCLTMTSLAAK